MIQGNPKAQRALAMLLSWACALVLLLVSEAGGWGTLSGLFLTLWRFTVRQFSSKRLRHLTSTPEVTADETIRQ